MMRWILLAAAVVAFTALATVAVQFIPESSASPDKPVFPVGAASADAAKTKGPKAKAVLDEPTTFQFGTLPQRASSKHTWKVKNDGEGTLELWMISSTCSCTLAKFKNGGKASVPPGETTEIDLEFETRENNGDYEKGAEIGTNDPNMPQFSLHVHGKVFPAVLTYPPGNTVNMANIANDVDHHYAHVAMFSRDRPDLKVVSIVSSKPDQVVVKADPLTPDEAKPIGTDKGIKLTIDVKDGLPLGAFREEVVVTTDHPQQPELRLSVVGKMSGPVNLIPDRLQMHQVDNKAGGRSEMIITVRNSRETKFEVAKAPKNLKVEVVPTEKKGRYKLVFSIPPGTPAGEIEDEVVLKTDHPKADRLIVPVSVWVQNAR